MENAIVLFPWVLSFILSMFLLPIWIKKARSISLSWRDMNKYSSHYVAGSGGIIVVLAFVVSVLLFTAHLVFIQQVADHILVQLFALLTVILLLAGIGLVDDLLGWKKGGLRRRTRLLLVAMAAIPLMAINAGKSEIIVPLIGVVELGLWYPLVLIPLGIAGATTTYNFLAGYNGLEAGLGVILLSAVALVAYTTGSPWLSVVCLCMVFALLGFLVHNMYPAQVFPGDVLTYAVGGLVAIISILGNFEKIALYFFTPFILETGLKLRGKLVKQSFGKPHPDGTLSLPYSKIYGLEHLAIYLLQRYGISPTEKKVVYVLWAFQLLVILVTLMIFKEGIFLYYGS